MSFDHVSPDLLSRVNINDVSFENIYQSNVPVRMGNLLGNNFDITIRNIDASVTATQVKKLVSPLESWAGFPNYYGVQRFGVVRPITHLVGKYIVQGDIEKAVMTYIAHPVIGENETTFALREDLEKTRDYSKAFHSYPDSLHFEKAILNNLIQNPTDFADALQGLPKNLLLMFVNAYESILFNKILSERIRRKIPIQKAIVGDLIAPVKTQGVTEEYIPVTDNNLEKVNNQISKKKATVTGLLLGYETVFAAGEMGEIEHKIIQEEKIDPRDFIIPEIPFLSSSGTRRSLLGFITSLEWKLHNDDLYDEKQALTLQFELQKGCYATSLLREIMKSADPKNY
jgi:tRNA pseudouridine13 synthase